MKNIKQNKKLQELKAAVNGRHTSTQVEILGTKYDLRILSPEANDWVASFTQGSTLAALTYNVQNPTLACALVSIDSEPVEALFLPESTADVSQQFVDSLNEDAAKMKLWRREALLSWLKEDVDTYVVNKLWDAYRDMTKEQSKRLGELENLSKRTP